MVSGNTLTMPGVKQNDAYRSKPLHFTTEALQQALKALASDIRNDLVFRCEELPEVDLPWLQLETISSNALLTIVTSEDRPIPLFLHLRCKPAQANYYCFRFETNFKTSASWFDQNRPVFAKINSLLQPAGGWLQINESKSLGCPFVLTLPGKI